MEVFHQAPKVRSEYASPLTTKLLNRLRCDSRLRCERIYSRLRKEDAASAGTWQERSSRSTPDHIPRLFLARSDAEPAIGLELRHKGPTRGSRLQENSWGSALGNRIPDTFAESNRDLQNRDPDFSGKAIFLLNQGASHLMHPTARAGAPRNPPLVHPEIQRPRRPVPAVWSKR